MVPLLSTPTSAGVFSVPVVEPKLLWPMTNDAALPAGGAFCVFEKTSTRLEAASATNKFEAGSTAIPTGSLSVCADTWTGLNEVFVFGWPYTRIAADPVLAPAGYSTTRLLPLSATNRSPLGPIAKPAGALSDAELIAAETELVKSVCPITASGVIRPDWFTGLG